MTLRTSVGMVGPNKRSRPNHSRLVILHQSPRGPTPLLAPRSSTRYPATTTNTLEPPHDHPLPPRLLATILFSATAQAQDKPIVGLIPKATNPIKMDGRLDDWARRLHHGFPNGRFVRAQDACISGDCCASPFQMFETGLPHTISATT